MIKEYQTIVDPDKGNCMQAALASLFNKNIKDVPNFIIYDDYYNILNQFITENGYMYVGMLHNKKMSIINTPTYNCFNYDAWCDEQLLTKENINKFSGVDGFFYASVLSPKYFNWHDGFFNRHAVIIDNKFNIVHDPNPEYSTILKYPLSDVIDCNGIVNVTLYEKIETK